MSDVNDGAISNDVRRAAVAALTALAASHDYRDRADAGRGPAQFGDVAEARPTLVDLMLNTGDTAVTRATAEAMLRRQDDVTLSLVASASVTADVSQAEWIHAALQACQALTARDPNDRVRRGAHHLITMLCGVDSILHKQRDD